MTTNIEQDKSDFEAWWKLEQEPLMLPIYVKEDDWQVWQAALKLTRERQANGEAVGYIKAERNALNTKDDNGNVIMVLRAHIDSSKVKDGDMIFTAPQQLNIPANIDELIYEHTRFNINQADDALTIKGIKSLLNAVLQAPLLHQQNRTTKCVRLLLMK